MLSLIYATVVATARFDVRALQFDACADAVQKLKTEFLLSMSGAALTLAKYKEFAERYADILADKENHSANDFRHARAERPHDHGDLIFVDEATQVTQIDKGSVSAVKRQAWLISSLLYLTPLGFVVLVFSLIGLAVDWCQPLASKAKEADQAKPIGSRFTCPASPTPKP